MARYLLDDLLKPRSVAVFGATERPESVGGRVFANLADAGFRGELYPINPKHEKVLGQACYASIDDVEKRVDLAVIATPARTVPGIIGACGQHGVRAAVVLSAGFSEADERGKRLEQDVIAQARRHGVRIVGPNCLGVISPHVGLNATFSKNSALPGDLALLSQSGALCTAILDWALSRRIGFSAILSLGNNADVDFGDVLDHLALDAKTKSILLYVEGVRDSRSFMSGLRAAARMKPVIVVKSGRHSEGSRAAISHTGALVGGDDAFDAALRRAGAIRVESIAQLFDAAQVLATGARSAGNRLAIVTNAGGPGVLATDRAIDLSVRVATLADETVEALSAALPAHWSHANPVDILGDAGPERYGKAVSTCLADESVDGAVVILTPQATTDPEAAARSVIEAAAGSDKLALACWLGEGHVETGLRLFSEHRIPYFRSPEAAVEAFGYLASYKRNQELLLQVPGPLSDRREPDAEGSRLIIDAALGERRRVLSGLESRAILKAFHLPTLQAVEARSANEALVVAESIGFPVAMKLNSPDITHKADVGGVRLGIRSAHAVQDAYAEMVRVAGERAPEARIEGVTIEAMWRGQHGRELLVGAFRDPAFGPVIAFGAGGSAVEVMRDRAVALPPLNPLLAERLIDRTRVARLLGAFRGAPGVDREALVEVLLRISELVCALPEIEELDINPLIVDDEGAIAVDARMSVRRLPPATPAYAHMAIHPYPTELVTRMRLDDGTAVTIRPIRPEDAQIEADFVRNLSAQSKYFRFMHALHELTPEMLVRFTQIDYDKEMALIAVTGDGDDEVEHGVARYVINLDGDSCEFAIVIDDAWHRKGIGSRLMTGLIEVARAKGLKTMVGEVLADNKPMLSLVEYLGFTIRSTPDDAQVMTVTRPL